VQLVDEPAMPLGEAVALGPDGASEQQIRRAVDELTRLVQAGGAVVAGAAVSSQFPRPARGGGATRW
jgi:hypothetical protein